MGPRPILPLLALLFLMILPLYGGCTCESARQAISQGPLPCRPRHSALPPARPGSSLGETAAMGASPIHFEVTSAGEANLVLPLATVPGRAGTETRVDASSASSID